MRRKHLPLKSFPHADLEALRVAFAPGSIFDDERAAAANLAPGMQRMILTSYRRWLGFMSLQELELPPADRIKRERVRRYVEHWLSELRPVSVAICLEGLWYIGRSIAAERDWSWLKDLAARIRASTSSIDRFDRLVPGWSTLEYAINLMDHAQAQPVRKATDIQFRDGLILALLSLWPIRRRSLAVLTVSKHLEFDEEGVTIKLRPQDTKSKREEVCRMHERLVPYLKYYLNEARPRLLGAKVHDGLWVSNKSGQLIGGALYDVVRRLTAKGFGKAMGLHDFRRAAATFLAAEAPELIGLIPGVLQHTKPEVSLPHYNLARSAGAFRRHVAALRQAREELSLFRPNRKRSRPSR